MPKRCDLGFLGKNDSDHKKAKAHIGVTNGKKVMPIFFVILVLYDFGGN